MKNIIVALRLSLCLALISACGGPQAQGSPTSARAQRDVLTQEEILKSTHEGSDLYQAIQSLRPHFLAVPRAIASRPSPTEVYVNGVRQSGLEALRSLRAYNTIEVKYLDPATSQIQIGPLASGGAVMVKTQSP